MINSLEGICALFAKLNSTGTGVGSCRSSTGYAALQFYTGMSKANAKKEGQFQSENNLILLKMMGESCVCLGSKEI